MITPPTLLTLMTSAMEKGTRFFVCYVLLTTVVVVVVSNEGKQKVELSSQMCVKWKLKK